MASPAISAVKRTVNQFEVGFTITKAEKRFAEKQARKLHLGDGTKRPQSWQFLARLIFYEGCMAIGARKHAAGQTLINYAHAEGLHPKQPAMEAMIEQQVRRLSAR